MSVDNLNCESSSKRPQSVKLPLSKLRETQENSPFYVDDDVLSTISFTRRTQNVPPSPLAEAIRARKFAEEKVQVLRNRVAFLAAEEQRATRALAQTLAETQLVLTKKAERSKDEAIARMAAVELASLGLSSGVQTDRPLSRVVRPRSGRSLIAANIRRISVSGSSASADSSSPCSSVMTGTRELGAALSSSYRFSSGQQLVTAQGRSKPGDGFRRMSRDSSCTPLASKMISCNLALAEPQAQENIRPKQKPNGEADSEMKSLQSKAKSEARPRICIPTTIPSSSRNHSSQFE